MHFTDFKQAVQRQFNEMKKEELFRVAVDKDLLWATYLTSFPDGTNPIFRKQTEHDCSCCRSFIKTVGDMVSIRDGQLVSIWDIQVGGHYQVVADTLSNLVKSCKIGNIFLHTERSAGVDKNRELADQGVITWEHFYVQLPSNLVNKEPGKRLSEARAFHDVFLRSLTEITDDALETVQELIAQNSLYRGAEKATLLSSFHKAKQQFKLAKNQDLFAWSYVQGPESWICKIRNEVIGTLLVDLSEGKDLEVAVKIFEDKVSGTNYQRPTALITTKMRDNAKLTLTELGLMPALNRRYAVLEDLNVVNVLHLNRDAKRKLSRDVFDDLPTKGQSTKNLDKVEEVTIDKFISDILPSAEAIEIMFENKHVSNLVSLIAPYDLTAPSMFKWNNPFSWSYNGDVADSIKERVKKAGGNVTGDICNRLTWNNEDDLDFHMIEPSRYEIFYANRDKTSPSGGRLDVDANAGGGYSRQFGPNNPPVENIFYENWKNMKPGIYELYVNQYCRVIGSDNTGFEVEIDIQGTVHSFSYSKPLRTGAKVIVAEIHVSKDSIKVVPKLESSQSVKEIWNIKTQTFYPVQVVILSPNFWEGSEIGNKHFFFLLDGCKNDGSARGFYNEFLASSLAPHRKAMEIVGSKMRTEESDNQLSGLGFSSTQRNSVLCRVKGSFTRVVKINF